LASKEHRTCRKHQYGAQQARSDTDCAPEPIRGTLRHIKTHVKFNGGVENYLVASTLRGILAQRLVRKLCRMCQPKRSGECQACHGIGYSGRTVIYELLPIDSAIRSLITSRAPDLDLERAAISAGMATLADCGRAKAVSGETTLEEVARVTATL
jgi:general secretion pathway protein E